MNAKFPVKSRGKAIIRWLADHTNDVLKAILATLATGGVLTGAWDWIANGAQSFTARIMTSDLPLWSVLLMLLFLIPLSAVGVLNLRDRRRKRQHRETWEYVQEIQWRSTWKGDRIDKLDPFCSDPNCRHPLKANPVGRGNYPNDAVFTCTRPGCSFLKRFEDPIAIVKGDVTREIEKRAAGEPPDPPKPPKTGRFEVGRLP